MLGLKRKIIVLLLCSGLFISSTVIAQTQQQQPQQQMNVPDADLEKFAKAYQGIQVAQQEVQKKMIAAVEEEDLTIETFNKIQQAKMQNLEVDAPEEDVQKHAKAAEKIEEMQPAVQSEMEMIIANANLTVEKYEQIASALQNNPELVKKLQKMIEG